MTMLRPVLTVQGEANHFVCIVYSACGTNQIKRERHPIDNAYGDALGNNTVRAAASIHCAAATTERRCIFVSSRPDHTKYIAGLHYLCITPMHRAHVGSALYKLEQCTLNHTIEFDSKT